MGYWFNYFLNSDSAQGRKLKPLGGELAARTMSNQPPGSKQLCMGLSNYQPHLPLCCRSTRNPGCSSTCRSVVRPPSSSCISLHHCASPFVVVHTSVMVAGSAGWEKQTRIWTMGSVWDNLMRWVSSLSWQILSCEKLGNILSRKKPKMAFVKPPLGMR